MIIKSPFIVLVLLLVFTGCIPNKNDITANVAPPLPVITANSEQVDIVRGSSCWSANGKGTCIDKVSPKELVKGTKPTTAAAGSRIAIRFEGKPEDIGVNIWKNEGVKVIGMDNDHSFILPLEKGIYVYDTFAHWKQGSGSFAFAIEIQ